jgi:hypothetical protein
MGCVRTGPQTRSCSLGSGGLVSSAGSVPDLVQLVFQSIEWSHHFLEGCGLRGDEQAPVLAPNIAQKGNPDGCRVVGGPGWMCNSKAPNPCMTSSPWASVPYQFQTGARNLDDACRQDKLSVMQPCKTPSVIAAMSSAHEAELMCHCEDAMEMLLSELMLFVGAVAVFAAVCTLENTSY